MTEEMKMKRESLKALSNVIKMAMKEGATEAPNVNAGLVQMYQEQGHEEIHSFKRWLELGKVVKKGEKALLLWGEPRKNTKGAGATPASGGNVKQEAGEADEYEFYPLAYVFSQLQVEPLQRQ